MVSETEIRIWVIRLLGVALLFLPGMIYGNEPTDGDFSRSPISLADHFRTRSRFLHQWSIEARPEYIIPTIAFLEGENEFGRPIRNAFSTHLRYSFKSLPNSLTDRIYNGAYQGIGLSYFTFGSRYELGNPTGVYLFQGARIAKLGSRVSLNYEWNFGISIQWRHYDYYGNPYNMVIGSFANAYLNTNFYFKWSLSNYFDLIAGTSLTHFSNGNTKFPNAGLNTVGAKIGFVYNLNRNKEALLQAYYPMSIPAFTRHISYDLALFGAWRRKGVAVEDGFVASPDTYPVTGFNFAPMFNYGYRFRAGVSLDGYYDGSANVYSEDYLYAYGDSGDLRIAKPPIEYQMALGISARGEYVMPYFSVNLGLGVNVLHKGGDMKGFYQILALKVGITRSSYLHIGYSLKDFHMPNFLMLGVGFRFNNKFPK